jgi:transcription initiation factor TFIID TATA-box-binding protein
MLKIVSMVIKLTLNQPLDSRYILNSMENAIGAKKGYPWARLRLKPENYDVVFNKSGKVIITGVKRSDNIDELGQRIIKKLKEIKINAVITKLEVINIVCLGIVTLNKPIDKIIVNLDNHAASYEPEQFPGLIYKNWGATFLLFNSGKTIITGIKNQNHAEEALEKFQILLSNA